MVNQVNADLFSGFYNVNDPGAATALVRERVRDDFVDHAPMFGAEPTKLGFENSVALINSAFRHDYRVERIISEGDARHGIHAGIWSANLEHVGPFMGVPASGKHFDITGITIYQLRDGRIAAHWEQFDVLAIMRNLGMLPS